MYFHAGPAPEIIQDPGAVAWDRRSGRNQEAAYSQGAAGTAPLGLVGTAPPSPVDAALLEHGCLWWKWIVRSPGSIMRGDQGMCAGGAMQGGQMPPPPACQQGTRGPHECQSLLTPGASLNLYCEKQSTLRRYVLIQRPNQQMGQRLEVQGTLVLVSLKHDAI